MLFATYKTYNSITIYLRDSFDCAFCIVSSSTNCSKDTNKSSLGFCEARKYGQRGRGQALSNVVSAGAQGQRDVVVEWAAKTQNRNQMGEKDMWTLGSSPCPQGGVTA